MLIPAPLSFRFFLFWAETWDGELQNPRLAPPTHQRTPITDHTQIANSHYALCVVTDTARCDALGQCAKGQTNGALPPHSATSGGRCVRPSSRPQSRALTSEMCIGKLTDCPGGSFYLELQTYTLILSSRELNGISGPHAGVTRASSFSEGFLTRRRLKFRVFC